MEIRVDGVSRSPMALARSLRWLASGVILIALFANASPRTSSAQGEESQPHLTPGEIQLYQQARTLIDWTPEEIRAREELRKLQSADSQRDLPVILQKVGERVEDFVHNFRDTACTERVRAQVWENDLEKRRQDNCNSALLDGRGGTPVEARSTACQGVFESKFRYLLLPRLRKGAYVLDEYRTDAKGTAIDYRRLKDVPILTSGFAASPLYFLPHNQAACRFRYFGRQRLKRQETEVVGFAQVPERDLPMTALLRLGDTTAQTLAQGLAWIDATSHEVLRIQTDLLAPRPDLRLEEETAEIDFSAIRLPERSSTFWLPTRVIVEVTYSHRHFRTIHEYADFKLFQVESRIGPHPKTEKSGFRG